jgi:hypothetical protein
MWEAAHPTHARADVAAHSVTVDFALSDACDIVGWLSRAVAFFQCCFGLPGLLFMREEQVTGGQDGRDASVNKEGLLAFALIHIVGSSACCISAVVAALLQLASTLQTHAAREKTHAYVTCYGCQVRCVTCCSLC